MIDPPLRKATRADAASLARLVNMAGHGLPLYVWTGLAGPGEDPWEIGRQRAARDSGSFSFTNAVVREEAGRVVAALIGYPLAAAAAPSDLRGVPPKFVPLQELEDLAPDTWYVNVLATLPECRGRGYGSELLHTAETLAAASSKPALSIIVADGNAGALRLYQRAGFRERARRPIVRDGWETPGNEWLLMVKPRPAALREPAPPG